MTGQVVTFELKKFCRGTGKGGNWLAIRPSPFRCVTVLFYAASLMPAGVKKDDVFRVSND
jgi:hypothetical protein